MSRKILFPILVLILGVMGTIALVQSRAPIQTQSPEIPPPLVRVMSVKSQDLQLTVTAQGSVMPRTESTLVAQVAGQIISVSSAFASGGFFEAGDILLNIDPRDYGVAVSQAQSRVAQAELRYVREREEAQIAQEEWERLGNESPPSSLVLRKPQLAGARAALDAARASLAQAELNLDRTFIRTPFAGRVRTKSADIGQYVNPGIPLARIYAVDYAEVRLPLPDDQLAYLDLSFNFRGDTGQAQQPDVFLHTTFAGQRHSWQGKIVRIEGEIDAQSRMVHLVAQVENPYGKGDNPNRPPLAVGMFVQAEILGKTVRKIVLLPRTALRGQDQVLVVSNGRLHFRTIGIVRADAEQIIVRSGLSNGEQVCLSPLDAVVDGMRVRMVSEAPPEKVALTKTGGVQ
ncbi:MAG: efflux RND transporter periplasmic adaptor subunit [bacterium]|nr:efflux RND transporter periplasmic adaptor subunit [bacterium]